uniref:Uncharacterized protein n=1 Tax=Eutreptiella gymnastica TaxID=73025 RepID=A0A7S4G818_9EUGL
MATPNNPSPPLQEGEFFCVGIVLLGTISGREVFRHPANPKAQSAKRTVTRTHMLPPGSERCADEMAAMVLKKTHTSTSATSGPPAICSTTLCASLQEWIAHGQVALPTSLTLGKENFATFPKDKKFNKNSSTRKFTQYCMRDWHPITMTHSHLNMHPKGLDRGTKDWSFIVWKYLQAIF